MANHPLNLALRFFLELAALVAMGYWSAYQFPGRIRLVWVILIPLAAAVVWGVFRIPSESPRGHATVPVPGAVRLLIEAAFFGFAIWGLFAAGATQAGWIFGITVLIHYLLSYDRILDLLTR